MLFGYLLSPAVSPSVIANQILKVLDTISGKKG